MTSDIVYAAGGVVWRLVDGKLRILVIERARYRDLTLPKGKVDPGETLPETAVREIHEETGLRIRLGAPVGVSTYRLPSGREKVVHYWAAEATDKAVRESTFVPGREVAAVRWLSAARAHEQLSYPVDREILSAFLTLFDDGVHRTFPLIALRHAKAAPRDGWHATDTERPLTGRGIRQASAVTGPLRAFGVRRIVSSPAVRCVRTVAPLAAAIGRPVHEDPRISQDAWEDGRSDAHAVVDKRLRVGRPAVLCSHGPVLPDILEAVVAAVGLRGGVRLGHASALDTSGFSVLHLAVDRPGAGIVAVETHPPTV